MSDSKPLGFVHPDLEWALEVAEGPFDNEFYCDRLDYFAEFLLSIDPACRLEVEHFGIDRSLVDTLGERLGVRMGRLKEILGLPRKHRLPTTASGNRIHGAPAFAALAILQLFGEALKLVDECVGPEVKWTFDTAEWFGRWIETPQRALAWVRPAEIVALPTGRSEAIARDVLHQAVFERLASIREGDSLASKQRRSDFNAQQ